nr:hypothetical protein [Nostoc sp. EkiNYC01]
MEERSGGRPRWQCHGSDRHKKHAQFAIAYVGRVRHCCALLQKVESDVQVV